MGCNCGKKRIKSKSLFSIAKGTKGSKIKKIWAMSNSSGVIVKKVDNK